MFAPDAHSKSPGWAVWGWLVPVVSLWFPRRITLDIWAASEPESYLPLAPRRPATLVNVWWTLWVSSLLLGNGASRYYARAEEPDAVKEAVGLLMVTDAIEIAAAVAAVLVVRALTRMQERKAIGAERGTPAAAPAGTAATAQAGAAAAGARDGARPGAPDGAETV